MRPISITLHESELGGFAESFREFSNSVEYWFHLTIIPEKSAIHNPDRKICSIASG